MTVNVFVFNDAVSALTVLEIVAVVTFVCVITAIPLFAWYRLKRMSSKN